MYKTIRHYDQYKDVGCFNIRKLENIIQHIVRLKTINHLSKAEDALDEIQHSFIIYEKRNLVN